MMNVKERIELLARLGNYILANDEEWMLVKKKAGSLNNWFIPSFIDLAAETIANTYLNQEALNRFAEKYKVSDPVKVKTVGVVMAGNIPLVGFHDFLCIFLSGHKMIIKPSSKDEELIRHLVNKLIAWDPRVNDKVSFAPMLKGADAFIATGSNNSSRYFDYYFRKYPHIIRRNRTSVAILSGDESAAQLELLADDVHLYFGLGCRNITKIFVPASYNFEALLEASRKYSYFSDHPKYKNNYDYNLAICLLNKQYYMTNGSLLLLENKALFSPISVLHYEFYHDVQEVEAALKDTQDIQAIAGKHHLPFGEAQFPAIADFADGTDTMQFLVTL